MKDEILKQEIITRSEGCLAVLQTCINYNVYKNNNNIEDKIKYLIENHLINIDIDMMYSKKLNSDEIVNKL